MNTNFKLYWGDLHNHNSAGYAKGSIERSIEIAKDNLDFFAFTGQSQWHDMKEYMNNCHMHWVNGFKTHEKLWPKLQQLIKEANSPGEFVAFLGYEWHSSEYGDYHLIYPGDYPEFKVNNSMKDLISWAKSNGAILIPHHPAYAHGVRGMNFNFTDDEVSPVLEIFSEHGCAERDEGPFPYIRHGMGGRHTKNTYQYALANGKHFGAVASSDNHRGFPGAYGEGIMAVIAEKLDKKSIWEAIGNRRVYAVSGDRIRLSFTVNENQMGQVIKSDLIRDIEVEVNAWDRISMVEIIRNNNVIYRHFPDETDVIDYSKPVKCRIEFGWGPWGDLGFSRICDWDIELTVKNGSLISSCPCFGSGPFSEERRKKVVDFNEKSCRWISYTSRQGAFEERPDALVFEIKGSQKTKLDFNLKAPCNKNFTLDLETLSGESCNIFTGGFQSEHIMVHRIVPYNLFHASVNFKDIRKKIDKEDFYYVRVTQDNGQMAWSSPIWVN